MHWIIPNSVQPSFCSGLRCNQLDNCQSWWPWCLGMAKPSSEVTAVVVLLFTMSCHGNITLPPFRKLCQVEEERGKQSASSLIDFFPLSTAVLLIKRPSSVTVIKRLCRSQGTAKPQWDTEATEETRIQQAVGIIIYQHFTSEKRAAHYYPNH